MREWISHRKELELTGRLTGFAVEAMCPCKYLYHGLSSVDLEVILFATIFCDIISTFFRSFFQFW